MIKCEELEELAKVVKIKSGKSWLELDSEIKELLNQNEADFFYVIQYLNKYLEGHEGWECTVDKKLSYVAQLIVDYISGQALDEKLYRELENYKW